MKNIVDALNYPIIKIGETVVTPSNIFIFIIIITLGLLLSRLYKSSIFKLNRRYNINHSTITILANLGYYIILIIFLLFALKSVGLDLSSFAVIAGALSVGIGFGLQNVVSNFISGIILMFEKSIKIGDYIQIDEATRGEVIDISMRSTVIKTNDNINLIIPNQSFIQNNVINWTLGDDIVRFRVPFGVAYGNDIDRVEEVVLEALKKSDDIEYIEKDGENLYDTRVVFEEMSDSSLNFELFVWVRGEDARKPRRTKSIFLKIIYKALNEASITIPFPQQDIYLKSAVPLNINLKRD